MTEQVTAQDQDSAAAEFVMPRANPGLPIIWYRRGTRDRSSAEVAYILHSGTRTATVLTSTGRRMDAVRHIDDPKLKLNSDQRENGAWDFTADYLDLQRFKAEMQARMERLERQLNYTALPTVEVVAGEAVVTKLVQDRTVRGYDGASRLAEYRRLVQRAKELGVETRPQATKAEIEQAIADAAAEAEAETVADPAPEFDEDYAAEVEDTAVLEHEE